MAHITPAQIRAETEAEIRPLGKRRIKLLRDLADLDARLRPLVIRAVGVEIPERRITDLTGVSRTTIRRWKDADTE